MISPRKKQKVLTTLTSVLGSTTHAKDDDYKFYCPFCNHRKKKLEVNVTSQKWNCWVCNTKGRSVYSLFKRLDVDRRNYNVLNEVYDDDNTFIKYEQREEEYEKLLTLPDEFKPLHQQPDSILAIEFRAALHYLSKRGITHDLIKKYNIGYCESGKYKNCLIIPSYDKDHKLNYFVARSYYEDSNFTYLNPPVGRDVIMFEEQINWDEPITLCEGTFDAIAIRRNAIPTLGVVIPKTLMNAIFQNNVKLIHMFYDTDALNRSLYYTNYFISNGIEVKHINTDEETDPSELGFKLSTQIINNSTLSGWDDVVLSKLNNI